MTPDQNPPVDTAALAETKVLPRFPGYREMGEHEFIAAGDMVTNMAGDKLHPTIRQGVKVEAEGVGHYFRPIAIESPFDREAIAEGDARYYRPKAPAPIDPIPHTDPSVGSIPHTDTPLYSEQASYAKGYEAGLSHGINQSTPKAPEGPPPTALDEEQAFKEWRRSAPYDASPSVAAKKGWMARAAFEPAPHPKGRGSDIDWDVLDRKRNETVQSLAPQAPEGSSPKAPAHDPLPWDAHFPEGSNGFWRVGASSGDEVATCYSESAEANAKLIAIAVNSHATLIDAVTKAREALVAVLDAIDATAAYMKSIPDGHEADIAHLARLTTAEAKAEVAGRALLDSPALVQALKGGGA